MVDLIPKNTDEEMLRYQEAERMLRARIPMKNNAALVYEADPITGRENAYSRLPSGGYVKIGDRAVTPVEAAKADAMVAAPMAADIDSFSRDYKTNFGSNPVMEDYLAANFTEAQTREYFAQRQVASLSQPGMQVPVKLNPEQIQMGVDVGAPMIGDNPPEMFEGSLSELGKGLVRGGLVEPSRFIKENFNIYDPLVFQVVDPKTGEFDPQLRIVSREEKAEIDRAMAAGEMPYAVDFETLFEPGDASQVGPGAQILGGISQFVGAYAGVGKLFRVGKGFTGAATQGAAADFLGFGGNDGRLTDMLLELGMPENVVSDILKTDPNDPDYVGRIKNALEGGVLGVIAEPISRTIGMMVKGGRKAELAQSIADLRTKSETAFSNGISDMIGAGRAIAQGDTEMLGEVFQRGRPPQSLSAAAPTSGPSAIIRPDNLFRGSGPIKTSLDAATKPYAVRVTGQSQIDDMVQSGLIRPKEGGYGQDGKAILYFGEMDDAVPNSIFTRPKSDGDKNYTIVADSSKIAGREGPIPLDDVQHIWTMRDGQMIDILDEVKLKNQNFDSAQPQASTAVAPTPVDTSYRMQQQPRGPEDDLPIRLDDLTKSTTGENAGYPADFYSANGPRFYAPGPQFAGDEFGQANRESYKAIMAVRGKPDAEVTIYRAVPDDPKITTINRGDFVTLSPTYAKLHGGSGYGPKGEDAGKILSEKVKVKDIYFDGNDVNEFGYFPEEAAQGSVGKDILELNLKAQPRLAELFKNAEVTADSSIDQIASTLLRAERSGIIGRRTADEILNGMKGQ